MHQGMKHSSGASSPVNGCLSLKHQPNKQTKKKSIVREFFSSVMCFIPSNLVLVLCFIKRSSAVGCPTRERSSVLLIDLWRPSNKAELDVMWCIRKAVWNQSNQSGWMISAYRRPNWRQQSQTESDSAAAVMKSINNCNRKSSYRMKPFFFLIIQDPCFSHFDRC